MDLKLDPASITANGSDTTKVTVAVADAHGNPIPLANVELSSDGAQSIGAVADKGDGTYEATVVASRKAGSNKIHAAVGGVSGDVVLTQVHGPAAHVKLSLAPDTIVADGSDHATATATVSDADGNPIDGETVTIASGGAQTVGAVTPKGDGKYEATITSTTTPGTATITATDGRLTDSETLHQIAGAVTTLKIALGHDTLTADGADHTTATATAHDALGNAVAGAPIHFSAEGGQSIGTVQDNGDGSYSATVTATRKAGSGKITASAQGASDAAMLHQVAGPAASIKLALSPATVVADGASTTTATATVADANDNPIAGEPVKIDGGAAHDNGDGTYSATVTSTTTPGDRTITAADRSLTAGATLTQTAKPADRPRRPDTPAGHRRSGQQATKTLPRFITSNTLVTTAARDGSLTLPGAWLACPAPLKACTLNTLVKSSTQIAIGRTKAGKTKRIRVLSSGSVRVNVTGKATIKLKLSSGALKALKKMRSLKVTVTAVAYGDDGGKATLTRTFTVTSPR